MHQDAAILIDLENFFLGREAANTPGDHTEQPYNLGADLATLRSSVDKIISPRRLAVARAYADFNTRRWIEKGRADYYLQRTPTMLMEHGIDPVQVFRFPGFGNKNAADMKMASDAVSLVRATPNLNLVVLVTGDADFIPVAIELRRLGCCVVGIGTRNGTKRVLPSYCDHFEAFEDLVDGAGDALRAAG